MSEEWGPWIDHDGNGCPCVGKMVEITQRDGNILGPFIAYSTGKIEHGNLWVWGSSHPAWRGCEVIRYRIRKPKGLSILQDILREVEDDGGVGYNDREMEEAST